jgi:hypothetical protein
MLYPGGSQADLNTEGFDWINNYWCNLMNEKGMNGVVNPARPFSIAAMIILCSSFIVFFLQFAEAYSKEPIWNKTIKISGVISMVFVMMIFTKYHDLMTIVSSFLGLFTVIGIIRTIYKSQLTTYKIVGGLCLLLLGLNNYIYYSLHGIELLPLIQKITFVVVLFWVAGLSYQMNYLEKRPACSRQAKRTSFGLREKGLSI